MKEKRLNPKMQAWIEARKRHGLSHAQVQMARELGMNPKHLGKLDNHRQEPWKLPLRQYIEHLYLRRFGRKGSDVILSIEEMVSRDIAKKTLKHQTKILRRRTEAAEPKDSEMELP